MGKMKNPDSILNLIESAIKPLGLEAVEVCNLFLDKFIPSLSESEASKLEVVSELFTYLKEQIPNSKSEAHYLDVVLYEFFCDTFLNQDKGFIDSIKTDEERINLRKTKIDADFFLESLLDYVSEHQGMAKEIMISYLKECEKSKEEIEDVAKNPDLLDNKVSTLLLLTPLTERIPNLIKAAENILDADHKTFENLDIPITRIALAKMEPLMPIESMIERS